MSGEGTPTSTNPLLEADIASLDYIFSADPLSLSEAEIGRAVEALRKQRAAWAQAEAEGKTKAPRARATSAPAAAKAKLSLDDLDE